MPRSPLVERRLTRALRGPGARIVAGTALVMSLALSVTSSASASGLSWSTATSIPGLEGSTGLDVGGYAHVSAISCSTAGNCSEGGFYYDSSNEFLPFVATETNGSWSVQDVPGIAALDTNDAGAAILSLSCSSAGNCAAGGYYVDASSQYQGFFVEEIGGVWQLAQSPTTLLNLNAGGGAEVTAVSCSNDGACAAVGSYTDSNANSQGFVASDVNHVWSAYAVPSLITLNAGAGSSGGGSVEFNSISCSSAHNCDAVGSYTDGNDIYQGFVASEVNGTWTAYAVPSLLALNDATNSHGAPAGYASFTSVSCWSAGNCAAGGSYVDSNNHNQGFVASEVNGTWTAYDVPTLEVLNSGNYSGVNDVSCSPDESCTAVGFYEDSSGAVQGIYISLSGGTWGSAVPVPGLSSLNTYGDASPQVVSCWSAGNCEIGGVVKDQQSVNHPGVDAFVASESDGVWSNALLVTGLQALNTEEASYLTALSCASDGSCLAGGNYGDVASGDTLDFVTSLAPPPASSPDGSLAAVTDLVSNEVPGSITASWTPSSAATSYTCTLLFAIDDPLTFSTTTTSPTCSFNGLSTDASYGVRVVANDGDVTSAFADTFASYSPTAAAGVSTPIATATSIVCVKGKVAKRIRGVDPRCPTGYHRRTT